MVCMSLEQSSSMGPLDYKELFIRIYIAFSATPSSDRYVVHVSVDMTACPWKFNYGDNHISSTATRDSHDAAPTHGTTSPTCASPLSAAPPLCLCVHDMQASWTAATINFLPQTHPIGRGLPAPLLCSDPYSCTIEFSSSGCDTFRPGHQSSAGVLLYYR